MSARSILLALALTMAVGCAKPHDIITGFAPTAPGASGTLTLLFTHASEEVIVAVNGRLVVEGAHTGRIRIDNVDAGWNQVAIAAGSVEKTVDVFVRPGENHAVPMATEQTSSSAADLASDVASEAAGALIKSMLGLWF
jgi:hypothetical protein